MKLVNRNEKANLILSRFVCCAMMVFLYSCGGGGGSDGSSGTGTVSFGLILQDSDTSRALYSRAADDSATQFECQEISTIEAEVFDENGELLAEGGPWECELHQGLIGAVEAGAGIVVKVFARDPEGVILFEGKSEPLVVVAGEVTDAGLITLTPVNASLVGDFVGTGFGDDGYYIDSSWTGRFNTSFSKSGEGIFEDVAASDDILDSGTLTYSLDFDGSLTATLSDGTVFNGILNNDNNILAVADTNFADTFIEMDVVIKKSAGLSNSILNGEYIGARISFWPSTALTKVTFDGDGNGDFEFLAVSDDDLDVGEFTYSVDSDGNVTITGDGDIASEGIVNGDGTVVSLIDTEFRGGSEDIDMMVLIKTSSGLSNATIDGDYIAVSFGYFIDDGSFGETTIISISADGVGNMEFEILSNSSGASDNFETIYTVNPNGIIRISIPNREFFDGIVNADGNIFTFVNTNLADDFIEMGVAIRKTQ